MGLLVTRKGRNKKEELELNKKQQPKLEEGDIISNPKKAIGWARIAGFMRPIYFLEKRRGRYRILYLGTIELVNGIRTGIYLTRMIEKKDLLEYRQDGI